jgi:DNA-binding IclR family transcriptional regulator
MTTREDRRPCRLQEGGEALTELPKNHDRYWVPGLERGLQILNVLAEARQALPAAEIARQIGLTRSSVFRLLYTLQHLGYVDDTQSGRAYDLSSKVLRLGYSYLAGRDIVGMARPVLHALARESGFSAHLGVLSDRDVVYLMHAPGRAGYVSSMNAGDRLAAYATPLGMAALAGKTREGLKEMFGSGQGIQSDDGDSMTMAELALAVETVRDTGYAISYFTIQHGGQSVAAPVRGFDGEVKAAVGISGPVSAFDTNELEERMRPLVIAAAAEIGRRLGHLA